MNPMYIQFSSWPPFSVSLTSTLLRVESMTVAPRHSARRIPEHAVDHRCQHGHNRRAGTLPLHIRKQKLSLPTSSSLALQLQGRLRKLVRIGILRDVFHQSVRGRQWNGSLTITSGVGRASESFQFGFEAGSPEKGFIHLALDTDKFLCEE